MIDEIKTIEEKINEVKIDSSTNISNDKSEYKNEGRNEYKKNTRNNNFKGNRNNREKPEFDSKTIEIRTVTRVVSGGRRSSYASSVVVGDRKGKVGFGTGKALDTQLSVEKATKNAKKNMISLYLTKNKSIPYDVNAKYKSSSIWITPNKGKGIIAGSTARTILALAGIDNVTTKYYSGTKNKINNTRSILKALSMFIKK